MTKFSTCWVFPSTWYTLFGGGVPGFAVVVKTKVWIGSFTTETPWNVPLEYPDPGFVIDPLVTTFPVIVISAIAPVPDPPVKDTPV